MEVSVRYFAVLKEAARCGEEIVQLPEGATARELFLKVAEKHSFPLALSDLRVAVDEEFSSFDHKLRGGEKVVFIPPVAGG